MKILETMTNISGKRQYIFPGDRNKNNHTNKETANAAIKRMGFKGERRRPLMKWWSNHIEKALVGGFTKVKWLHMVCGR